MEEIYVFGDQTADCRAFFAKIFTRKDSVLLQSFLERASDAVRAENANRSHMSKAVPSFSTIQELVDRYYLYNLKDAAIESALVCIAQFSHFIGAHEERLPSYIRPAANARIIGLCTGLITAVAVAAADSLTALIPLAIESVRIAFRTGAYVGAIAQQLECDDGCQSWSTIVSSDKDSAQQALDDFHAANQISNLNRLWVSAASTTSVTISGPPSTRARLLRESPFFTNCKQASVPVYAPYHASHLYSPDVVEKILRPQSAQIFGSAEAHFTVCASTDNKPLGGATAIEMLRCALQEIITEPIRWDKVLKICTEMDSKEVKVFGIGPTNLTGSIVHALKCNQIDVLLEDHSTWTTIAAGGSKRSKREADIAIVGMSGRFPDAADHELFWQLLEKGLDVHRPVPPDRYPVDSHTDPSSKKKNTSHTPFGNFIEKPGLFDARFFNMSPREATQTDPMQRLMLTTGYEAMEMAGIVPGRTPSTRHDRIGTFYGQTSDDWREVNAAQDIDTYFISGGVRAFGPGRLNYFFKFSGPSFSVDTACSSSFAAINVAITSLRAGECDTAFTGGANVLTNPDIFSGLSRGHFLSRTGSCKTWDDGADGYCRGDGVCTVILKRMDDALADKDPILGVIRGIGTNHSAEAVSITHPCAENQAFLFNKVLKECNVDSNDINYVEMHGTGTQAGDGIEMESVSSVFAPRHKRRRADQPLYVGAVKSNIGHGEAVSGVSALIKVLLMLQKNKIPPHTGIKTTMNRNFAPDLKERGVHIAFNTTPFPRPVDGKRLVFINNFSAAGGNTAMLLEDGPVNDSNPSMDSRSTQIVTVSAKSLASFRRSLSRMESYISADPNIGLGDLSYTTTARRCHYTYRAAFPVQSSQQLLAALKSIQNETHNPIPLSSPPVAFAYTGQGSQYTAMGKELYATCKQFRRDIDEFNSLALRHGLPAFTPLLEGLEEVQDLRPAIVQLGMCCIQMALTRLWATWGVTPSVVIGHSLGEYAALQAAGVLSVSDTILLVGTRAILLEQKCTAGTHAMLAVRCPVADMRELVDQSDGRIEIACVNGVTDTVLSGTMRNIDEVAHHLGDAGYKCTKLRLPYAFHSSQVDPILTDFKQVAASVTYHAPRVPVISPLLSDVVCAQGVIDHNYLGRHCRGTVDFVGALTAGMSTSTINHESIWLEVGAHPLCSSMLKSCLSVSTLATLRRDEDPWQTMSRSVVALYLAGKSLDWEAYHKDSESQTCLSNLPSYGFDERNYWLQYTKDWLLYKGDFPQSQSPAECLPPTPPKIRKTLSTSVQSIVSESIDGSIAMVTAESDMAHPKLWPVIKGHLINGSGLCPSSLYADQALTLVEYAYQLLCPGKPVYCNVGGMENPAPLLLKNLTEPESQLMRMTCKVDLSSQKADFMVTSHNGKKDVVHAHSIVRFEDPSVWKEEWSRNSYLIRSRMDVLQSKMEIGEADKVGRAMAYKLFSALVDYSDTYQGMQSVVFDGQDFEAMSNIRFRCSERDGVFKYSPFCIDSAAHLSGFTVNATVNAQDECYISHGWSTLRLLEPFAYDKSYQAYVKMQPVSGSKMRSGDVWVFDDQKNVVAFVGGLRFQCIPRKLMDIMMPKPKATSKNVGVIKPAPTLTPSKSVTSSAVKFPVTSVKSRNRSLSEKPSKSLPIPATANDLLSNAFDIIAVELAVDQSELVDNINWADLGVDSLMSLGISGRFREELEIEVESSIFTDHPSVGALRKFLSSLSTPQSPPIIADASSVDSTDDESDSSVGTIESGMTTPDPEDFKVKAPHEANKSEAVEAVAVPPSKGGLDMIATIRMVIAQEMEMNLEEITEITDLTSLGMDSLMALTVLGKLREEHDIDVDATVLADSPTLGHLRKALGLEKQPMPAPARKREVTKRIKPVSSADPIDIVVKMPPATSVLLQGSPKSATKNLFLFPDGSGSATSYVSIPAIDNKNLAVYGLNCPFMKDPTSYTCGIEGVSKLYLEEVFRRQPSGPYILGGWSAGGVIAYEVTRQLADLAKAYPRRNYEVEKLILIDSPCPIRLEPLPARLHHFFDEIGLLGTGTGKTPKWLLPHFEYSIKALTAYRPELRTRLDAQGPSTLLIWATEGVCGRPSDPRPPPQADDPKSMKWLLENRTDFGPNGWENLLGVENCSMVKVVGNHFTMMKAPVAADVGRYIRRSLC